MRGKFFDILQGAFHQPGADFPCYFWDADEEYFLSVINRLLPAPSCTKLVSPLIEIRQSCAIIHYDILGLTYWMLNRLEELGPVELDKHGRFSALSSHAYKHNYLERPIVDEWLLILGQVILKVWPTLELKQHKFDVGVSHDVDAPSLYGFKSWFSILRIMAGHLLKRRDLAACCLALRVKLLGKHSLHDLDPYNTFEWLMDLAESQGLMTSFYFISGRTDPVFDAEYELDEPPIRKLLSRIHKRGHEIGLHPSYRTYNQLELLQREAEHLKQVCEVEGIEQSEWGGRMHYLRMQIPTTLRHLEEVGISYDSSLGYADRPGFRCGTCHSYLAFDAISQETLDLIIKPLIVMESSIYSDCYLGFKGSEALNHMRLLKKNCEKVAGTFNLLWHNSSLVDKEMRDAFEKILTD